MVYEILSFEAALEKTSVTNMMKMVWKTVPCSGSRMTEVALSKSGPAPLLGVSETRSTVGRRDCPDAIG